MKPRAKTKFFIFSKIKVVFPMVMVLFLASCTSERVPLMNDEMSLYRPSVAERAALRSVRGLKLDPNTTGQLFIEEGGVQSILVGAKEKNDLVAAVSEDEEIVEILTVSKVGGNCSENENPCFNIVLKGKDEGDTRVIVTSGKKITEGLHGNNLHIYSIHVE